MKIEKKLVHAMWWFLIISLLAIGISDVCLAHVSTNDDFERYSLDGATLDFGFDWPVTDTSEIRALVYDETTRVPTVLVENTGYTVDLPNDDGFAMPGGTLTLASAYTTDDELFFYRVPSLGQADSYKNLPTIQPASFETSLDKLAMQIQYLYRISSRAMLVPEADVNDWSDLEIPALADRVNSLLGFDGDGMPTSTTIASLGLGTMSTQDANAVAITGGTIAGATVDGRTIATDGTKLDGIELLATADQTPAEIMIAMLTVDGDDSDLDADFLDGQHGAYYQPYDADLNDLADGTLSKSKVEDSNNWDDAHTHSQVAGGNSVHVSTTENTNWDTGYTDRLKWDGGATGLTPATGRTSLGLVIGTDVQAFDADLTDLADGTLSKSKVEDSTNWDTGYTDRLKWDGGATGLTAGTGRTSLGLGALAVNNTVDGTEIELSGNVAGDIAYYDGGDWVRLAKGSAGQVLEMNAGATAPEWDTDDGAGAASIDNTAYPTGWSGDTVNGATRDALYDAIEAAGGGDLWSDALDSDILPTGNDNTFDLGSAAASFAEGWFDSNLMVGGYIGVGLADPTAPIQVVLDGGPTALRAGSVFGIENSPVTGSTARMGIIGGATGFSVIDFGNTGDNDIGGITYNHNTNALGFKANANSNRLIINSDGTVGVADELGVGITAPEGPFHLAYEDTTYLVPSMLLENSGGTDQYMRFMPYQSGVGGNIAIGGRVVTTNAGLPLTGAADTTSRGFWAMNFLSINALSNNYFRLQVAKANATPTAMVDVITAGATGVVGIHQADPATALSIGAGSDTKMSADSGGNIVDDKALYLASTSGSYDYLGAIWNQTTTGSGLMIRAGQSSLCNILNVQRYYGANGTDSLRVNGQGDVYFEAAGTGSGGTGNVLIGSSTYGTSAVGTLVIADGTANTTNPAGQISLYSLSGELWVEDAGGTATQLSADTDVFPDDMAVSSERRYVTVTKQHYLGIETYISKHKAVELLQQMAWDNGMLDPGTYIIQHVEMDANEIRDWDENEAEREAFTDTEILKAEQRKGGMLAQVYDYEALRDALLADPNVVFTSDPNEYFASAPGTLYTSDPNAFFAADPNEDPNDYTIINPNDYVVIDPNVYLSLDPDVVMSYSLADANDITAIQAKVNDLITDAALVKIKSRYTKKAKPEHLKKK